MMEDELRRGVPPTWAVAWGEDEHGVFASFVVGEVVQRMRWIPAGSFLMGSPEEEGRYGNEDLHEVALSRGYWLADTPVTQGLWEVVMDGNPSHFVDPRRPVETVSWQEAVDFCVALAEQVPGLRARLPTEAEWERACRAGTAGATWKPEWQIRGDNDAPVLDAIAWYGGNSGVDYDLDVFRDSEGWSEKQHPHTRAGTRAVATREANPWGLFDMLGNVYEWCADAYGSYGELEECDPLRTAGTSRVIRGGSWSSLARGVRAAFRDGYPPGLRSDDVGLRVAGGPALRGGAHVPEAQEAEARDGPGAERDAERG